MTKNKTIFPTVMQAEVVNIPKDKRVTIIATGDGSGKSISLLFKAIHSECRVSTIIHPNYKSAKVAFETSYKFLQPLGFRASQRSMILSHDKLNKKIKFVDGSNPESLLAIARDLIMFDRPEYCPRDTLYHQIRRARELVFSSIYDKSCKIRYRKRIETPSGYEVDHYKSDWCSIFLDNKHLNCSYGLPMIIESYMLSKEVYVISGMTKDNPYLYKEACEFKTVPFPREDISIEEINAFTDKIYRSMLCKEFGAAEEEEDE